MRGSRKTYKLKKEIPMPRSKVWDLLSNTDHLNRMIGLGSIRYSEVRSKKTGTMYREILSKAAGVFAMRWNEFPFEWTKERFYAVEREYSSGPLERFYGGVVLEDADTVLENGEQATVVELFGEFTPANFSGLLGIPLVGKRSIKKTLAYLEDYLKLAADGHPDHLPQSSSKSKVNQAVLDNRLAGLRDLSVSDKLIGLLKNFLLIGSDEEVAGMRPYALADKWKVDPEELLKLFLYATKEGVLNLSWELMCPNCRVSKEKVGSLSDIRPAFHCDLCGIQYEANFDRYVELHFSVAPNIRKAHRSVYCIGGPVASPHVYVQKRVNPGGSIELPFPKEPFEWRLRVLRTNDILDIQENQYGLSTVHFTESGWKESFVSKPKANQPLRVENKSENEIVIVLEKIEWDQTAVTAAKVTAMQEFRDLFSSEVLAPGQQIKIENVSVLFSDLKGSTALYEVVGDANAYSNVRRHFDFLTNLVRIHSGSVVKTMGDAVMAVFYKPEDAVKAAYAIHESLGEFNTGLVESEPFSVKIGIHSGPAIVVNSNDRLDYFGRTVNLASRIQGKSDGDAFVISEELYKNPSVESFLEDLSVRIDPFYAELKGIDETARLVKISL